MLAKHLVHTICTAHAQQIYLIGTITLHLIIRLNPDVWRLNKNGPRRFVYFIKRSQNVTQRGWASGGLQLSCPLRDQR